MQWTDHHPIAWEERAKRREKEKLHIQLILRFYQDVALELPGLKPDPANEDMLTKWHFPSSISHYRDDVMNRMQTMCTFRARTSLAKT